MPKAKKNGENQLDFENMPVEQLVNRAKFADWYYLRTGDLVTTPMGEKCWRAFLKGDTIIIKDPVS